MDLTLQELISAPRERVWSIITDVERAANYLEGVKAIDIIEQPDTGLVGLTWLVKRVVFGKPIAETLSITAANPQQWYEVTTTGGEATCQSRISLDEQRGAILLSMELSITPRSAQGKMTAPLSKLIERTIRRTLEQDLRSIRLVAEKC